MHDIIWDELALLFDQALAQPPDQRTAFLDQACGDNLILRAELSSLLAYYDGTPDYFDHLAADINLSIFPDALPTPLPDLTPDLHIGKPFGHYVDLERIGRGGMGVVYRAWDTKLNRFVALKFPPPEWIQDASVKKRFLDEARTLAAVTHANICTIYEINEVDGQFFIAMEYIEGTTLKQQLGADPLPVDTALHYAIQITSGLRKAHKHDIIHLDIKPGNVMVTPEGELKILDFGLARINDPSLEATGAVMGSPPYMSPEQARGTSIDHRTDLWALGVVLYEMMTGTRPFMGENVRLIIRAIHAQEPAPVTALNPKVPTRLAHIIHRCLKKSAAQRYANAQALLDDLIDLTLPITPWQRLVRQPYAMAAALVLLLVLSLALIPPTRHALLGLVGWHPLPEQKRIAVLPFINNLEEDQANLALADGLMYRASHMIPRLGLPKDTLWVVPPDEIRRHKVTTPEYAFKNFGVNLIVNGDIHPSDSVLFELALRLYHPARQRTLTTATVPVSLETNVEAALLASLADLLDVSPIHLPAMPQSSVPKANMYYLQGRGYLQRYDQQGNIDQALALFEQARAADPAYALAHAGLCEAQWEKYRGTNDRQWADASLDSCDQARSLAREQPPIRVTTGRIFLETGQLQKAEAEIRGALDLEPWNADAHRWLGRIFEERGQLEMAVMQYKQAIGLQPTFWVYYNELGILYSTTGQYIEAGQQFERMIELTPDNYLGYNGLGVTRRNMNQMEEAKNLFEQSIARQPNAVAYRNLGRLYFRDENYSEAARMFEEACALRKNEPWNWSFLGHAYYWAGDERVKAEGAWREAIALAETQREINPRDEDLLLILADAHIALGERAKGENYLRLMPTAAVDDNYTPYFLSRIYAMLGEQTLALIYLELALESNFDPYTPDRDPWLRTLRTTPGYQTLRQRFLEQSTNISM